MAAQRKTDLHSRLIALQSDEELKRKERKASGRHQFWSQEEMDMADRDAHRLADYFRLMEE